MSDLLERLKQRPNFREDGERAEGLWWRRAAFDRDLALDALARLNARWIDYNCAADEIRRGRFRDKLEKTSEEAAAILKALRGTADGEGST